MGTYESYLAYKRSCNEEPTKKGAPKEAPQKSNKEQYAERKKMASLEKSIARQEKQIVEITESFHSITYGTDAYDTASNTLKKAKTKLEELSKQWEMLVS